MTSEIGALRLQLSQLEDENEEIRRERDQFRAELSKFRKANGMLESQVQELGVKNNDLRRKLARVKALPPLPHGNGVNSRSNTKDTGPQLIEAGEIDVIEVDESSDVEESVSLPVRDAMVPAKPFILLSSRRTSSRATSEKTRSSVSLPPDERRRSKRRIEQVQDTLTMTQNKKKKEEKYQSDEEEEALFTPEPSVLARVSNRRDDIKAKPEALSLSNEAVSEYLQGCVRLSINPVPKRCLFSRQFIGETYGGSQFTLLATSTDKKRTFIFPTPDINPDMPTVPGNPGLLLSCRCDMTLFTCTLFSRNELKPARWEYIGEYESKVLRPLSAAEFKQQKPAMKLAWAKKIVQAKKWPVYCAIRARIFLRKAGREVTDKNVEAEILRITSNPTAGGELGGSDVIKALERGEEQLDIVRMVCVLYDHQFVEDMNARTRLWTAKSLVGKGPKRKAPERKEEIIQLHQMDSESSGESDG